jgi:hypothetical protein
MSTYPAIASAAADIADVRLFPVALSEAEFAEKPDGNLVALAP